MQHLRDRDGAYWTGFVHTEGVRWPVERSTWTAAAMLLALDAVTDHSAGGRDLPSRVIRPQRIGSPASPRTRRRTRIEPRWVTSSHSPPTIARR